MLTFAAGLLLAYRTGDRQDEDLGPPGRGTGPGEAAETSASQVGDAARSGPAESDAGPAERLRDLQARLARVEAEVASLRHQQQLAFEREHARILEELTSIAKAHQDELTRARSALREREHGQARLERDLAMLRARHTQQGILVSLSDTDIPGPLSSDRTTSKVPDSLARLADVLMRHPRLRALLRGSADVPGEGSGTGFRSEDILGAVKTFLIDRGVEAERIRLEVAGTGRPIAEDAETANGGRTGLVEVYLIAF
ncbi:hypothetical protein [Imhoffiella purpurea]|nr:hypothetical protein [Imhoffiella purpurea]